MAEKEGIMQTIKIIENVSFGHCEHFTLSGELLELIGVEKFCDRGKDVFRIVDRKKNKWETSSFNELISKGTPYKEVFLLSSNEINNLPVTHPYVCFLPGGTFA